MTAQRQPPRAPIIPARRGGVTVLCAHAFLATLVGLALRLLFVFRFPTLSDDSQTYLQLARNWADHHVYGLWLNGHLVPTDLRMPGYPAFLAGLAMLFRRSERAIVLSQAVLDLATCFLAAALGAALAPVASRRRVAIAGLWLAATCPFLANYSAAVLTEVLATFLTTAALVCFARGLNQGLDERDIFAVNPPRSANPFLPCNAWSFSDWARNAGPPGNAIALRGRNDRVFRALVEVVEFSKVDHDGRGHGRCIPASLVPWAARNLVTLHEVQILAPRYVTMPGEYRAGGLLRVDRNLARAFPRRVLKYLEDRGRESEHGGSSRRGLRFARRKRRESRISSNNITTATTLDISPEVDHEFAEIARERTRRHPFRTYVEVPFQRALTIWFTPRTELLPIDGKLWPLADQWSDSHADVLVTAGFAALGYLYVAMALGGVFLVWRRSRAGAASNLENAPNFWGIALILAYLLVRTAFLTTIEAPEPRYVITCYPAVFALGALCWSSVA